MELILGLGQNDNVWRGLVCISWCKNKRHPLIMESSFKIYTVVHCEKALYSVQPKTYITQKTGSRTATPTLSTFKWCFMWFGQNKPAFFVLLFLSEVC